MRNTKHFCRNISLVLIVSVLFYGKVFSQDRPEIAPLNPEFIEYLENLNRGLVKQQTPDGYGLGLIPSPVIYNFDNVSVKSHKELPLSYDLRTVNGGNWLTSVKNQGGAGTCWAFTTYGAVESYWLKTGLTAHDLSEQNLASCHGFDWGFNDGGNHDISTAYLSRRDGPISEADDPYSDSNLDPECNIGYTPVAYVGEARYLPGSGDAGFDPAVVKQAIIDNGALYVDMHWDGSYYNSTDKSYYYNGSSSINHAVLLVGWDDNKVLAGNTVPPPGNGAWIIRNSWGTGWGESGYFYISYYDTKALTNVAYYPGHIEYDSDSEVHYYDDLGHIGSYGWSDGTDYGLVKFSLSEDQDIEKIGTYVVAAGSNIDIHIYESFDGSNLTNLLGSETNINCEWPGYYTFDLSDPVSLNSGDDFYVKIKYNTGTTHPIPLEYVYAGYSSGAVIETGKYWASNAGTTSWVAFGGGTSNPYDICIKAYASKGGGEDQYTVTFNVVDSNEGPIPGAMITVTQEPAKNIIMPLMVIDERNPSKEWPVVLFTDINGQASFDVLNGNYNYEAEKDGYVTATNSFTVADSGMNVDITLLENATIDPDDFAYNDFDEFTDAVTIITWNDATEVTDVYVDLGGEITQLPFDVVDIDGYTASLTVHPPDGGGKKFNTALKGKSNELVLEGEVEFDVGSPAPFTITFLNPTWQIEISVYDIITEVGIENAEIYVQETTDSYYTDEEGLVDFRLPEGGYVLDIFAEGYLNIEAYPIEVEADFDGNEFVFPMTNAVSATINPDEIDYFMNWDNVDPVLVITWNDANIVTGMSHYDEDDEEWKALPEEMWEVTDDDGTNANLNIYLDQAPGKAEKEDEHFMFDQTWRVEFDVGNPALGTTNVYVKTFLLTFIVEDAAGDPVPGATVNLEPYEANENPGEIWEDVNNPEFEVAARGDYEYTITAAGYNTQNDIITNVEGDDEIPIVMIPDVDLYTLFLLAEPEEGGTVDGEGEYEEEDIVPITATPNEGYEFVNWTGDTDHVDDPGLNEANVTMPGYNITLTANFRIIPHIVSITPVNNLNVEYGTAIGVAISQLPATTTITDQYDEVYDVDLNWSIEGYDGNTAGNYNATGVFDLPDGVVQSDPETDLEVTAIVTVLEEGEELPYITDIADVEDVEVPYGTEEADAIEALAETTTITASDVEDYTVYLSWTIDSYNGEIPGDYTATGEFDLPAGVVQSDPPTDLEVTATVTVLNPLFTLTLIADPDEGGEVDGDGEYEENEEVPLTATANSGYRFINWTDEDENEVSDEAEFDYTMPAENVTLTANFEEIVKYNLYLLVEPDAGGTVDGDGKYEENEKASLSATANSGYEFVNWTDEDNDEVSDEAEFEYTMPAKSVTLTANFALITYTVTFTVNDENDNAITNAVISLGDEINDAGDYIFEGLVPDVYNYTVTAGGYFDDTGNVNVIDEDVNKSVTMTIDNSSVEAPESLKLLIYPNPTRDKFTVESNRIINHVKMIDISGQIIRNVAVDELRIEIHVSDLRAGMYFIQIHTANNVITERVQVTR